MPKYIKSGNKIIQVLKEFDPDQEIGQLQEKLDRLDKDEQKEIDNVKRKFEKERERVRGKKDKIEKARKGD